MKVPCVLFVLVHLLPWIHAADLKLNSGGDALTSAQSAFRYAREHVVGQKSLNCGWPRTTFMIGLWVRKGWPRFWGPCPTVLRSALCLAI